MHMHPSRWKSSPASASMDCAGGRSDTASSGPVACRRAVRPGAGPTGRSPGSASRWSADQAMRDAGPAVRGSAPAHFHWELSRGARDGPRPPVTAAGSQSAGKHHAVDHERVLARREQVSDSRTGVGVPSGACAWKPRSAGATPPGGNHRRASATASMARRSSISCSTSRFRAARYSAESPGNETGMVPPGNSHAANVRPASRAGRQTPRAAITPCVPAGFGGFDEETWQMAGCFRACLAPAIALTAQSADEAGDDLACGPCEVPGDAAGLDDRRVGQQGRRTHRNRLCRAASPQQRWEAGGGGAGREGPGVRGRWFLAAGAVTGRAVSCTIGIWSPVRAKPRRPWLAARPVRDQTSSRRRVRRRAVPQYRRR